MTREKNEVKTSKTAEKTAEKRFPAHFLAGSCSRNVRRLRRGSTVLKLFVESCGEVCCSRRLWGNCVKCLADVRAQMRLTAARKVTTVQGQTVELALLWPPHWHPEVPARISKQHLPLLGGSGCCCLLACQVFTNLLYLSGALWLDFLPFLDSLSEKRNRNPQKQNTRINLCVFSISVCLLLVASHHCSIFLVFVV